MDSHVRQSESESVSTDIAATLIRQTAHFVLARKTCLLISVMVLRVLFYSTIGV